MTPPFLRRILAFFLVLVLAPTWLREAPRKENHSQSISFTRLPLPPLSLQRETLGAFSLEGAWQITSPNSDFGGYSALISLDNGRFLAISDLGQMLEFSPPGRPQAPVRIAPLVEQRSMFKSDYDAEAATYDPASHHVWIAWETSNTISRHDVQLRRQGSVKSPAMDWGINDGPESLVRLENGQFLTLREAFHGGFENRRHQALLFDGDPVSGGRPMRFDFAGPDGFKPTDAAQLPDGRILVLMRRLTWPMPPRFTGRIVLADPADIRAGRVWQGREVARLNAALEVDNFEGMAITPRADNRVNVWLISDDNGAASQRTLLWQLAVDPRKL